MTLLLEFVPIITEAVEASSVVGVEAAPAVEVGIDVGVATGKAATAAGEADKAAEAGEAAADAGASGASKLPVFDMTAGGTTAGANAAHEAIVQGISTFAKWAATQAAKQALLYAGMKSAEAGIH